MSIKEMVKENELAPGIIVYSYDNGKASEWLSILKTYSDPLLKIGEVVLKSNDGYYSAPSLDHRQCKTFSGSALLDCHPEDPLRILSDEVSNFMDKNVAMFCNKYNAHKAIKNHDVIFLKYEIGDFFNNHNDDCPTYHRTVSSITYFNDDYDGGELCFRYFNIEHKPEQGDCVLFSSAFPYMHRVKKITKGARYAAVNWYRYV